MSGGTEETKKEEIEEGEKVIVNGSKSTEVDSKRFLGYCSRYGINFVECISNTFCVDKMVMDDITME